MPDSLTASEYILDNFKPSDRIAILLRNRATGEVIQRIALAEKIASRDFQEWLTDRNQAGFDIYVGMNPLKDGAYGRTKRDIHEIRHVYLDVDYRGPEAVKAIQNSDEVPKPNFVLDTSPGKHQVVWKVEGVTPQEAEDLQQRMAHEFGADIAATDVSRVLRLPDSLTGSTATNAWSKSQSTPIKPTTSAISNSHPVRPRATATQSKSHRA